jgi:hypothetical protein
LLWRQEPALPATPEEAKAGAKLNGCRLQFPRTRPAFATLRRGKHGCYRILLSILY